MKRLLFLIAIVCTFISVRAAGEIQLADLCRGTYYARQIYGVNPLLDGESYSQMTDGGKKIVRKSFRTGEQTDVIFDADNIKTRIQLPHIDGYIMSPNELLFRYRPDRRYSLVCSRSDDLVRFDRAHQEWQIHCRSGLPADDG